MRKDNGEFELKELFQFNSNGSGGYNGESLNWNKYASPPDQVHELGRQRESAKREKNPNMRYAGYIEGLVGEIRAARTRRGHGFQVLHVPSEGKHHAEVHIAISPTQVWEKTDRIELRELLKIKFSDLVPNPEV